jgi:hypothetical protein
MTFCTETLEKTDAVDATCTTGGNSEYYCCSVCKKYYSDAEAKKEIEEDSWIIPALGHTAGETVVENKVDATCTTGGSYDNVVYCTVCEEEISRETVTVPALDHDYGEATYTDNGDGTHTASYVCGNDETHVSSEDPEAHTFVDGVCICGATEPAAGTMKGDVDLDGDIDARDLTLMARHIAKIELITDPAALDNADINSDGDISAFDLTKLARHIAKIETIQ